MPTKDLIIVTLYFISFLFILTSIGLSLFNKKQKITTELLGASYMIGLGVFGYTSFVLGLIGKFDYKSITVSTLILFLFSLFRSVPTILPTLKKIKNCIKIGTLGFSFWLFFVPILLVCGSLYLTSMQPPYTADELHYHLPEAMEIVNNKRVNIFFGGHYFYGNIPKLMEIIFASGIVIHGFEMTHLFNFSVLLAFLLIVYGLIKKYYGRLSALLSVFLILMFDDFTWNATSGYIDSATVSYEIGAFLFLLLWVKVRNNYNLLISGSLMGISLSLKYSPIFTLVFMVLIIGWLFLKQNDLKIKIIDMMHFLIPLGLFAGYWYFKNLILYLNPFYPLYFGHVGVPEIQYKSLIDAIQEFRPKTVSSFFDLISRYKTINGLFVYICFYLPFIIPFIKKVKWPDIVLFIYFISYCIYWFFFATHQIRFLAPAIIIAIILSSRVITLINLKYYLTILIVIIVLGLGFGQKQRILSVYRNILNTKLHLTERQYALGNETKSHFLNRHFGCQYSVIEYLENNKLDGGVIDNWSVWHAPSVSFYSQHNRFSTFGVSNNQTIKEALTSVQKSGIKYLYFNTKVKDRHLANLDEIVVTNKNSKLPLENKLLEQSEIIFTKDDCKLYQLNFSKRY